MVIIHVVCHNALSPQLQNYSMMSRQLVKSGVSRFSLLTSSAMQPSVVMEFPGFPGRSWVIYP